MYKVNAYPKFIHIYVPAPKVSGLRTDLRRLILFKKKEERKKIIAPEAGFW